MHGSCKDCLLGVTDLGIQVCDHYFGVANSLPCCPLDKLPEKPFVPLTALDVGHAESEHDDTAIVVYGAEHDVEQAVLVLSLATAVDEDNVRISGEVRCTAR